MTKYLMLIMQELQWTNRMIEEELTVSKDQDQLK